MEKLKLLNENQISVMRKIPASYTGLQSFQDLGVLVNELDIITREMKNSVSEPNKFTNSTSSNTNEPLDLSVK